MYIERDLQMRGEKLVPISSTLEDAGVDPAWKFVYRSFEQE